MVAAATVAPVGTRCSRLSQVRACWVKSGPVVQGRAALRMPFAEPVVVTPWNTASGSPGGRSQLSSGRDISEDGIAFLHREALPCQFAAVSFRGLAAFDDDDSELVVETVLVRLLWCRFVRSGHYLSGGRFEKTLGEDFGQPFAALLSRTGDTP
ncbi:MAG: hypothetical protein M3552_05635 [Planctomycetota bacterium]|nr:hypothetical protein [Planctomycetaceae bacterium]MDQ3330118.1 hypothetical protein [Planctomycetota bacterium]